jgi:EAL and modified HD-GYP domain-containing signal transduction protein
VTLLEARPEVAVVRQPIADARRGVVGYELLFGDQDGRRLDSGRDAQATSALLVDVFGEIGLAELSGRHPAWVSVARDFLVEVGSPPFRPDTAVLQIGAYPAEDDLLSALQGLSRSGYTLALNQYDGRRDIEPLLALCPLVKVDVQGRDEAELRRIVELPATAGATLVATGVADLVAFAACEELGFTLFQGDFFALPSLVRRGSVATGGLGALRALGEINRPDLSFEELERLIATDVGLSIKLLRYVNSAFFSLPRELGSVREALAMLGTRTVRRWATVMAMASVTDAPSALVTVALQRARMCEMLAGGASAGDREGMFTIGLFSVADALLDAPMEEVLESLPFSEEIRAALLRRDGPKGALLSTVLAYERGEFPALAGGPVAAVGDSYRQAVEWADETEHVIG